MPGSWRTAKPDLFLGTMVSKALDTGDDLKTLDRLRNR
jgi:hypothetical protein